MRRFELVEGTSAKFWEVAVQGATVRTRYGRLGSAGQTSDKEAGSEAEAARLAEKLVGEKTRKGYVEVPSGAPAPAAGSNAEAATREPDAAANAPSAAHAAAPTKPAAAKAEKRPKPPKKSAPEYQAVTAAFGAVLSALGDEEAPPVDALLTALDAELALPHAALVLDAEAALWALADRRVERSIATDASLEKLFAGDPPEALAEARAHHAGLRAAQTACIELKHRALARMLAAGCDPFVVAKREWYTPLESFVRSLPLASADEVFAYPWSPTPGRTSALEVLDALAARGDAGTTAPPGRDADRGCAALGDAAHGRWPLFDHLLGKGPDVATSLSAWVELARVTPHPDAARSARLLPLARHLVALGADGLVAGGAPGAMLLALLASSPEAVDALLEAGASLDGPSTSATTGALHVATKLLPPERDGDRQNRAFRVAAGLTPRDVADALVERYDAWEALLGDREGTAFGSFGHLRRGAHERARTIATSLAARGAQVSGRRRPERLRAPAPLPADLKPRVDAALTAIAGRLGADAPAVSATLAAFDASGLDPLAYLSAACSAVAPSLAPRASSLGAAWLGELLGYADAQLGPDLEALDPYDAEARAALREGAWLGTRADAAAVLLPGGAVVEVSIRGGTRPLAGDLASFVEADLGAIAG